MCLWFVRPCNLLVVDDVEGEWVATVRTQAIAESIVKYHNDNENGTTKDIATKTPIDPAKIHWISNKKS